MASKAPTPPQDQQPPSQVVPQETLEQLRERLKREHPGLTDEELELFGL